MGRYRSINKFKMHNIRIQNKEKVNQAKTLTQSEKSVEKIKSNLPIVYSLLKQGEGITSICKKIDTTPATLKKYSEKFPVLNAILQMKSEKRLSSVEIKQVINDLIDTMKLMNLDALVEKIPSMSENNALKMFDLLNKEIQQTPTKVEIRMVNDLGNVDEIE